MRIQAVSRLSSPATPPASSFLVGVPTPVGDQQVGARRRRFPPRPLGGAVSGGFSPRGHSVRQWCCGLLATPASTFLCRLRSTPITELPCYYGHSDSCGAGSSRTRPLNTSLLGSPQVSLLHAPHLPDHSVANHPTPPGHRFHTLPFSVTGFCCGPQSGLRLCTAGSSRASGRIAFVILRTDRSPPVASHPVSRRRSYLWLQAGERLPGEDLHLSDDVCLQAHGTHAPSRAGRGHAPLGCQCATRHGPHARACVPR